MDLYYPNKNRPHIHWTKGNYIGINSYDFVGKSPQQIHDTWNGTRDKAESKTNWDTLDKMIKLLIE